MAKKIWQAFIQDNNGNVIPNASVRVKIDGVDATIYSDEAGTAIKANPFTASAQGYAFFYADDGEYSITASSGSFSFTFPDVILGIEVGLGVSIDTNGAVYTSYPALSNYPLDATLTELVDEWGAHDRLTMSNGDQKGEYTVVGNLSGGGNYYVMGSPGFALDAAVKKLPLNSGVRAFEIVLSSDDLTGGDSGEGLDIRAVVKKADATGTLIRASMYVNTNNTRTLEIRNVGGIVYTGSMSTDSVRLTFETDASSGTFSVLADNVPLTLSANTYDSSVQATFYGEVTENGSGSTSGAVPISNAGKKASIELVTDRLSIVGTVSDEAMDIAGRFINRSPGVGGGLTWEAIKSITVGTGGDYPGWNEAGEAMNTGFAGLILQVQVLAGATAVAPCTISFATFALVEIDLNNVGIFDSDVVLITGGYVGVSLVGNGPVGPALTVTNLRAPSIGAMGSLIIAADTTFENARVESATLTLDDNASPAAQPVFMGNTVVDNLVTNTQIRCLGGTHSFDSATADMAVAGEDLFFSQRGAVVHVGSVDIIGADLGTVYTLNKGIIFAGAVTGTYTNLTNSPAASAGAIYGP